MWRPGDLVLRGTFCTVGDLRAALELLRRDLGASALLVLACDTRYVLRSLTVACGSNTKTEDLQLLEAAIRSADFTGSEIGVNELAVAGAFGEQDTAAWQRLVSSICNLASGDKELASRLSGSLYPVEGFSATSDLVVAPLILGASDTGEPVRLSNEQYLDIAVMLNATAQASTRRDTRVVSEVDERISPQFSANGLLDFESMAQQAADLALSVTDSDGVAIFIRDSDRTDHLTLLALAQSKSEAAKSLSVDRVLPENDVTLGGNVSLNRRTLQLPPGPPGSPTTRTTWLTGERAVTELATPIPGPLASIASPTFGVLTVIRFGMRDFSAYDLALIRNVCLRVALLRSTYAASLIAAAIANLRSRPPRSAAGEPPLSSPEGVRAGLPEDRKRGLARVPAALESVAAATNSQSVTVRLATADFLAPEPHGLVLVRAAAHPPARLLDKHDAQRESEHRGMNWLTITSGELQYAPDVENDSRFVKFRENTRSSLTVPIRHEGRLIGTLNLESRDLNNYGPFLPQVQALAGAIGRTLADSTSNQGNLVLERAASLLDNVHNLESSLRSLQDEILEVPMPDDKRLLVNSRFAEGFDLVDKTARYTSAEQEEDNLAGSTTIGTLLRSACKSKPMLTLDHPDFDLDPLCRFELDHMAAESVYSALRNVLSNLKDHTGMIGRRRRSQGIARSIELGETCWDGRSMVTITFRNSTDTYISSKDASEVYRVPIKSDDGSLRLGAFLTSLRMTEIGGMAHFSVDDRGEIARTTLMIPVHMRNDNEEI